MNPLCTCTCIYNPVGRAQNSFIVHVSSEYVEMKKKASCIFLLLVLIFSLLLMLNQGLLKIPGQYEELLEEPLRVGSGDYDRSTQNSKPQNSVFAGEYWEKMTMAMDSMFTLAAIAKQWNASMPLPFTYNSFLFGLPTMTGKNLDTIYNREGINALMKQYHLLPFVSFEEFLQSASRSVIVLEVMFQLAKDSTGKHIHDGNCTKSSKSLLSGLNQHANRRSLQSFHVKKCCHILATQNGTSPMEISTLCSIPVNATTKPVTVLLRQWRGVEIESRYRLVMKNFNIPHPSTATALPHSASIVSQSTAFLKTHFKKHSKFVGVHLRSERVWLYISKKPAVIDKCFQMLYNLITKDLTSKFHDLSVFYFGDDYTTTLFGKQMSKHDISLLRYKMPSKLRDIGFEAQVEQDMVSRAEVLVLMGGGAFQQQIYNRYRTLQNKRLVYRVCDTWADPDYMRVINWNISRKSWSCW